MVKLGLQISKPALLLNRIAQRYSRLSRILMEYVDNSLDDAERYYNEEQGAYSKHVKVQIGLSLNPPAVFITDNCNGMNKKQMTRLIQNVGESMKHSKFTNGQFGFGVHAFRAAAKTFTIWSKTDGGETHVLHIDRESCNFHPPVVSDGFKIKTVGGTQVVLRDLDKSWIEHLTVQDLMSEIQYHFDGLLRRKNLSIIVRDSNKKIVKCKAFSYRNIDGKRIRKTLTVDGETVKIALWVSTTPIKDQHVYFTSTGRRINEVHEVKSFMAKSLARYGVWNHPHVTGYLEVGNVVNPVITRDEFQRTTRRRMLYKTLVEKVEPELVKAVEEVNAQRRTLEMGRLGNILSKCFNQAIRKDKHRLEGQASYVEQVQKDPTSRVGKRKLPKEWEEPKVDENGNPVDENGNPIEENANPEGGEENQDPQQQNNPDELPKPEDAKAEENKPKRQKREDKMTKLKKIQGQFSMVFVNELNDGEGVIQRSCLIGDDMFINISHPDFEERMKVSTQGSKLQITQRLNSYIAAVSANAYKQAVCLRTAEGLTAYNDDHYQLFTELMDLEMSLERQLRKYLPAIQKEVGK